jgi:CarD family transcriptional regulator
MDFHVGDTVVHWAYGPSEIVRQEEKAFSGSRKAYYVLRVGNMTIWVPSDDASHGSLRPPTSPNDFGRMFDILRAPGDPLSADRLERKSLLMERMKDGTLESKCRVVRDLRAHSRGKKLNESDVLILEQARNFLLSEWNLSLAVPRSQAENELNQMLEISQQGTPLPAA